MNKINECFKKYYRRRVRRVDKILLGAQRSLNLKESNWLVEYIYDRALEEKIEQDFFRSAMDAMDIGRVIAKTGEFKRNLRGISDHSLYHLSRWKLYKRSKHSDFFDENHGSLSDMTFNYGLPHKPMLVQSMKNLDDASLKVIEFAKNIRTLDHHPSNKFSHWDEFINVSRGFYNKKQKLGIHLSKL